MKKPRFSIKLKMSSILMLTLLIFCSCGKQKSQEAQSAKNETAPPGEDTAAVLTSEDLRNAALTGRMDIIEQAIEQGVDPDQGDQLERTALMFASYNGHTEIARFLVEHGADITKKNAEDRTSLMFAASGPFPETVEFLLEKGADPNVKDNIEGWTPLMYASAEGNRDVVQILLDHDADVSAEDTDGETAIDFARNNGHSAVVSLLQENQ